MLKSNGRDITKMRSLSSRPEICLTVNWKRIICVKRHRAARCNLIDIDFLSAYWRTCILIALKNMFQIPPVFNEKHLVVYALIAQNAHVPNWVEVIIASPVGPLSFKVFPSSTATEGTVVHR